MSKHNIYNLTLEDVELYATAKEKKILAETEWKDMIRQKKNKRKLNVNKLSINGLDKEWKKQKKQESGK